jgi:hypothetical protein
MAKAFTIRRQGEGQWECYGGRTGQHLLRGRVIAKGQTTVRGSERSDRAGIFSGGLVEGKAKPEPTSHSFDGLKYVGQTVAMSSLVHILGHTVALEDASEYATSTESLIVFAAPSTLYLGL